MATNVSFSRVRTLLYEHIVEILSVSLILKLNT